MQAISDAQHYIYFENQFFISGTAPGVQNQVTKAVVNKILSAIRENRKFKVYVVFPQPEFVTKQNVPVLKYQYYTISRGSDSLANLTNSRR